MDAGNARRPLVFNEWCAAAGIFLTLYTENTLRRILAGLAVIIGAAAQPVTIRYQALSPAAQRMLKEAGVDSSNFDEYVAGIEPKTIERERDGEHDHLIFYVLQSGEFTSAARIEPAISAKEFVESGVISRGVQTRMERFASSKARTERLDYFRSLLPREDRMGFLRKEYARAMRSLYDKEFGAKPHYYESRGHSTDTRITANYALWIALSVLKGASIRRVLIVGPGLDTAPRTELVDRYPPQSYQPYAVAQMLRDLQFADVPEIECVDINDRVIRFIQDFARRAEPRLEFQIPSGDPEFESWARGLNAKLGAVPRAVAKAVTARKLNIVTQGTGSTYDLVIATNVLLYFNDAEALLAIANIGRMTRPGGYFIHNELRPVIDRYAAAAGLAGLQARTVKIGEGAKAPLYDAFAVYVKK
jgi:SAM-dependent methyltransferase